MAKRTVRDLSAGGRRVLIRADLNVPLDEAGKIGDDLRITQFAPTLRHVLDSGGRAIVMSHLGRPDGKPHPKMSLRPVAARLGELVGRECAFAADCIGPEAEAAVARLGDGELLLLENLRFHAGETIIDSAKKNADGKLSAAQEAQRVAFAEALGRHADAYVNDAFGTCHRKHVSMYDVAKVVPCEARAIGFLVEKELAYLGAALESPKRPFVAVLGGAKVSDKIGVIRNLIPRVDQILVGGAMMFTFWAAKGRQVGKSLCERDQLELAGELMAAAGDKLQLPVDTVVASAFEAGASHDVASGEVPADRMGLDIGPATVAAYRGIVAEAGTIVWNGPMGAFELKPFDGGTVALAEAIAAASDRGAVSIIGGGDSAAAVQQAGLAERISHISTGGGASLKFLEGKAFAPLEVIGDV